MIKKKLTKEFGQQIPELGSNAYKYVENAASDVVTKPTVNHVYKYLICALGVLGFTGGICYIVYKRMDTTKAKPGLGQKEYVFFSSDGKSLTLSEKEVLTIKQKCIDGVLPSAIAEEYGITPVMVCRIANGVGY